jgi:hypothetical protein
VKAPALIFLDCVNAGPKLAAAAAAEDEDEDAAERTKKAGEEDRGRRRAETEQPREKRARAEEFMMEEITTQRHGLCERLRLRVGIGSSEYQRLVVAAAGG